MQFTREFGDPDRETGTFKGIERVHPNSGVGQYLQNLEDNTARQKAYNPDIPTGTLAGLREIAKVKDEIAKAKDSESKIQPETKEVEVTDNKDKTENAEV